MKTRLRSGVPRVGVLTAAVLAILAGTGRAQGPGGEPQLPREGGMPLPGASSALMGGPNMLMGGVPAGQATEGLLPVSITDAIARGLKQNLGVVLGEQSVRSAAGSRWQSLSGLLPNAGLRLSQTREEINLEEFGFPVTPGQSPILGPFNVSAVHVVASAPIFDYAAIQRARAGGQAATAAAHSFRDVRDLVVFVTANLYLQAVTGASRIDAARAQLKTAQALYDRAFNQKQAGVVAGIEVLRAQVQLQSQQQRVIFFENEFAKQKLALERAVGIPLGQRIELTDRVPYSALDSMTLEESLTQAYGSREDLQGALALARAAQAGRQAAIGEGLPSVSVTADLGRSSSALDTLHGTYSVAASVHVPIFQGGRVRGRVLQADAQVKQEQAQVEDLRARIEYEVRSALLDVQAADQRVRVAKSAADLAGEQLTQAQDRFTAGVTSNIEVVQAQETVATATENYLSALYAHNLAKISLARAIGLSEERARQFLAGTR
ncbi:MAG TPA: TolC family protein [Vicinamibacterales bacterium]